MTRHPDALDPCGCVPVDPRRLTASLVYRSIRPGDTDVRLIRRLTGSPTPGRPRIPLRKRDVLRAIRALERSGRLRRSPGGRGNQLHLTDDRSNHR